MAQSALISQRIALDGAEEILKQLTELGVAGEKAVKQIQTATEGAGPGLSNLSGLAGTLRNAFASVETALAPVKDRFIEFGSAISGVLSNIEHAASILGVGFAAGLAGGVTGLVDFIKDSAEAGHQLELQAGVLGISIEALQTYRRVAAQAGVDAETLFTGLTRLAQNVGKEQEKLTQDALTGLQKLPLAAQQIGVGVVRGVQTGAESFRGFTGNIQETFAAASQLAPVIAQITGPQFVTQQGGIAGLGIALTTAAQQAGKAGEDFRLAFNPLINLKFPALTFGEQFKNQSAIAKDPIQALGISLKDLQNAQGNFEPIINTIFDRLSKISGTTDGARIALGLLGRGWREIIVAFREGQLGIDAARAAVESGGLALDDLGAHKLATARGALINLGLAATGLRNQLALVFAPGLTEIATAFTDAIKANADTLKAWAQSIAGIVLPALRNLLDQFGLLPKTVAAAQPPPLPTTIRPTIGTGERSPTIPGLSPTPTFLPSPQPPSEAATRQIVEGGRASTESLERVRLKVEELQAKFERLRQTLSGIFEPFRIALEGIATVINLVFGTDLGVGGTAALLVVTRLVGGFAVLRTGIALVGSIIGVVFRGIASLLGAEEATGFALLISRVGLLAAGLTGMLLSIPLLIVAFALFRDQIVEKLSGVGDALTNMLKPVETFFQQTLPDVIKTFFGETLPNFFQTNFPKITAIIVQVTGTIAQFFEDQFIRIETLLNGLVDWFKGAMTIIGGFLDGVWQKIKDIASAIGGLISGVTAATESGGLAVGQGFAAGGPVARGPSGVDRVPAWLSRGEFVVRTAAVGHYGAGLFHALNSLSLPRFAEGGLVDAIGAALMPMPRVGLADGGVVPAGPLGPMQNLTLNLGGEAFRLDVAPGAVFDKLSRHARSSALRSAGRKPSWYGS